MSHLIADAVNILIINDGKLMLGRRQNTGWKDGMLCVMGGHVEENETPTQAVIREAKEELGVTINPNDIEFTCVAARRSTPTDYVSYVFTIEDKDYKYINNEPDKCTELVWVDPSKLPNDVIEDFKIIITNGLVKKKIFLEINY